MLALRCTQKLLKRVGAPVTDPPSSTTGLGDWFAQPVSVGHQRLILLVSERSRLPLVMSARNAKALPRTFADALAELLFAWGIPPADIAREIAECHDVTVATTNSRSVLGSMNDFARMMQWVLPDSPDIDLLATSVWLGDSPTKPLSYARPFEVTYELHTDVPPPRGTFRTSAST